MHSQIESASSIRPMDGVARQSILTAKGSNAAVLQSAEPNLGGGPERAVLFAFGKALEDLPRRVRVLADVKRRIQGERASGSRQQHAGQHCGQRDSASSHNGHILSHYLLPILFLFRKLKPARHVQLP
jgi:hypothetical protein